MFEAIGPVIASFFAGLIDSIVGGGGLILIPALFATFQNASPSVLFGTNKSASCFGTAFAAVQYAKRVSLNWPVIMRATAFALIGAFVGAWTVTKVNPDIFRKALPVILVFVFLYTLIKKDFGSVELDQIDKNKEKIFACLIGLSIGFYDGFLGPGAGSFFIFLFVRVLRYDFLRASAAAKVLNTAANLSALALFAAKGSVWWKLGIVMAAFNVLGSVVGTRLALKYGSRFIRIVFIGVVGALILKNSYDAYVM